MKGGCTETLVLVLSALAVYESAGGEFAIFCLCVNVCNPPTTAKTKAALQGKTAQVALHYTLYQCGVRSSILFCSSGLFQCHLRLPTDGRRVGVRLPPSVVALRRGCGLSNKWHHTRRIQLL